MRLRSELERSGKIKHKIKITHKDKTKTEALKVLVLLSGQWKDWLWELTLFFTERLSSSLYSYAMTSV